MDEDEADVQIVSCGICLRKGVLVKAYTNRYQNVLRMQEHNYYEAICEDDQDCFRNIGNRLYAGVRKKDG